MKKPNCYCERSWATSVTRTYCYLLMEVLRDRIVGRSAMRDTKQHERCPSTALRSPSWQSLIRADKMRIMFAMLMKLRRTSFCEEISMNNTDIAPVRSRWENTLFSLTADISVYATFGLFFYAYQTNSKNSISVLLCALFSQLNAYFKHLRMTHRPDSSDWNKRLNSFKRFSFLPLFFVNFLFCPCGIDKPSYSSVVKRTLSFLSSHIVSLL